jgi:hypothetical protein
MDTGRKRNLTIDDDERGLLIEAVEMLRLYQQGFRENEDGRVKLYHVRKLEARLRRRPRKATHCDHGIRLARDCGECKRVNTAPTPVSEGVMDDGRDSIT